MELTVQDKMDLLAMIDLQIYQMMRTQGYSFEPPFISHWNAHVNYPFMNVLMDWYLSKGNLISLKRLCLIEAIANNMDVEKLPHDLREAVAGTVQNLHIS